LVARGSTKFIQVHRGTGGSIQLIAPVALFNLRHDKISG